MGREDLDVYRRLVERLGDPYYLGPILLAFGLITSIAVSLTSRSITSDIVVLTALAIAMIGGLLEIYYFILVSWAFNALKGSGLSLRDVIYALISIGLYYVLIGIALLSWRIGGYSQALNCPCSPNALRSLVTLGVALAVDQACLSTCARMKLEEHILAKSLTVGVGGEPEKAHSPS